MSDSIAVTEHSLPHDRPQTPIARAILFALRRMAAAGLTDAHAETQMLSAFGLGYRRPLMFLRVFIQELSRVATRTIAIAPCCCARMTEGEAAMLLAIDCGRDHPDAARAALGRIAGTLDLAPALSVAQALGDALDDLGRPLAL